MDRFQKTYLPRAAARRFAPALTFLAVLAAFVAGLGTVSGMTARQQAQTLEDNIRRSAVHCYALEGFYPDNLAYLEDHYGLYYDKERYIVSYEVVGSNLIPDITVIDRSR